jgi:ribosomal protein S18 acetylase RimI-like enzyme
MGLTADHNVTDATVTQWAELSDALATAFHNAPVFGWLLPNPSTRTAALRRFFAIETRHIVLPRRRSTGATPTATGQALGAALVLPPERWRTPLRVQAAHAPSYLRVFRQRLPRALGVLATLERHHPHRPHYYLPYIGVRPDAQGRGLGTALLTPVLERCDREDLPAYLEASSPDNARLYRRLGFTTQEVLRPLGSPPIELMIRNPRAAAPPRS